MKALLVGVWFSPSSVLTGSGAWAERGFADREGRAVADHRDQRAPGLPGRRPRHPQGPPAVHRSLQRHLAWRARRAPARPRPSRRSRAGATPGAELAVVVHLARLSGTGRVRLIAYRVASGALAHADSIAVAGGPDDLDPALKRLAVGLATGKQAGQTADIESVTQKESDPYLKQTANKMFGLRLEALVAFNRPNDETAAIPGIGVFWMYDARTFLGEIALDVYGSDAGSGFSVGIGGYYPFSRSNLTPYVGTAVVVLLPRLRGRGGQRHPHRAGVRAAVRAAVDGAVPGRAGLLLQHLRRATRAGDHGDRSDGDRRAALRPRTPVHHRPRVLERLPCTDAGPPLPCCWFSPARRLRHDPDLHHRPVGAGGGRRTHAGARAGAAAAGAGFPAAPTWSPRPTTGGRASCCCGAQFTGVTLVMGLFTYGVCLSPAGSTPTPCWSRCPRPPPATPPHLRVPRRRPSIPGWFRRPAGSRRKTGPSSSTTQRRRAPDHVLPRRVYDSRRAATLIQ